MEQLMMLSGRNAKIYIRDRGAVFFSFLSALVVICLMVFFLGDMNVDDITRIVGAFSEKEYEQIKGEAKLLVLAWTFAGILSINAVTVSLAVYSGMIKDRVNGRLNAIYTAPVSRLKISLGYIVSAWLVSVFMCIVTLALTEFYGVTQGMEAYTLTVHIKLVAMIMLNSFVYAALMYPLSMIAKTEGAWSAFGTVIGTLVGFLGGIYIPIGALSDGIAGVMKCTPIIYGTSMFRTVMTETVLGEIFQGVPEDIVDEYRNAMGIRLTVSGYALTLRDDWLILFGCGMIFFVIGMCMLKYGKRADR